MASLVTWFNSFSNKTKAVSVFSTTLLVAFASFFLMTSYMGCQSSDGMQPYQQAHELINTYMDTVKKPVSLDAKHFSVLKAQQKILTLRKEHYLKMGIIFFKNYYGVLVMLMVFSCIGGVVLFMIANQGWSGTGPVLKAFFLAVALLIMFFGLFPTVFQQKENFDANLKQYMNYTKAELGIVDQLSELDNPFFAFRDSVNSKTKTRVRWFDSMTYYNKVDTMILANNLVINNLTNYILNIDANQIKSPSDFSTIISGYLQSKRDSLLRQH